MPTYEYECRKCGRTFDRFQRISEPPLKSCPHCKGKVRRLIGAGAGIIFKGSGFYSTDYRSPGYREAQKKDKETSEPKKEKSKDASKSKEK